MESERTRVMLKRLAWSPQCSWAEAVVIAWGVPRVGVGRTARSRVKVKLRLSPDDRISDLHERARDEALKYFNVARSARERTG